MRNPFILSFLAVAATTSAVVIRHDVEINSTKTLLARRSTRVLAELIQPKMTIPLSPRESILGRTMAVRGY